MNVITALDLFVYYTHKMWRKNRPAGKEEHDFERYNKFDANYFKIVQHVKTLGTTTNEYSLFRLDLRSRF